MSYEYSPKIQAMIEIRVQNFDVPAELAEKLARECGMTEVRISTILQDRYMQNPLTREEVRVDGVSVVWWPIIRLDGIEFRPYVSHSGNPADEWQKKIFEHYQIEKFFWPFPEGHWAVFMPVPNWVRAVSDDWATAEGQWMMMDEAAEEALAFVQKLPPVLETLQLALEASRKLGFIEGYTLGANWPPGEESNLTAGEEAALAKVQQMISKEE